MSTQENRICWPDLAEKLAGRAGESCLHPRVVDSLRADDCRRLLVACSGGPDSVFMLCVLWVHAKALGVELVVAHYNHRWRGESSDMDAAFVSDMAAGLGCPYVVDVRPENEAAFTETTARALRLDFLRAAAHQYDCQSIAFGHQQNDILETQLQRIARGVSSEGLAAPRPVHVFRDHPTHVRPILNVRSGDIRMSLRLCAIPWCEDRSNDDISIPRNALRREVIPDMLDAMGRDVSEGAARSRQLLEEDADALECLARERFSDAYSGSDRLDRVALREAPRALVRRALVAWLHAHGLIASVSAPAMGLLLDAIEESRDHNRLSAGAAFVVMDAQSVFLEAADFVPQTVDLTTLETGEDALLSTGALLNTEWVTLDEELRKRICAGAVDPLHEAYVAIDAEQVLEVRGWMPGDRFRPIGAPGRKKLKDWFIDRHIPRRERKQLPVVLIENGEIVWVPSLPPAESCRVGPATTRALRLTYQTRDSL